MATTVTLSLPDEVYRQAQHLAQITNRAVTEVLTDTIASGLPPLASLSPELEPVEELSDQAVLELAESQMDARKGRRFSRLLDRQQAGELSDKERAELDALMQYYQIGLLRKAEALSEAVRRGLRPPLES